MPVDKAKTTKKDSSSVNSLVKAKTTKKDSSSAHSLKDRNASVAPHGTNGVFHGANHGGSLTRTLNSPSQLTPVEDTTSCTLSDIELRKALSSSLNQGTNSRKRRELLFNINSSEYSVHSNLNKPHRFFSDTNIRTDKLAGDLSKLNMSAPSTSESCHDTEPQPSGSGLAERTNNQERVAKKVRIDESVAVREPDQSQSKDGGLYPRDYSTPSKYVKVLPTENHEHTLHINDER